MINAILKEYLIENSNKLTPALESLYQETNDKIATASIMCGPLVSTLLKICARLTRARLALDIGTFTGFSALSLLEAIDEDGEVITCDIDPERTSFAKEHLKNHPRFEKITFFNGDAMDCIKEINQPIDLVFLDANKKPMVEYYDLLIPRLRKGGLIIADDVLWKGQVIDPSCERKEMMDNFNQKVKNDDRVENVLLPLRNGINMIYKL